MDALLATLDKYCNALPPEARDTRVLEGVALKSFASGGDGDREKLKSYLQERYGRNLANEHPLRTLRTLLKDSGCPRGKTGIHAREDRLAKRPGPPAGKVMSRTPSAKALQRLRTLHKQAKRRARQIAEDSRVARNLQDELDEFATPAHGRKNVAADGSEGSDLDEGARTEEEGPGTDEDDDVVAIDGEREAAPAAGREPEARRDLDLEQAARDAAETAKLRGETARLGRALVDLKRRAEEADAERAVKDAELKKLRDELADAEARAAATATAAQEVGEGGGPRAQASPTIRKPATKRRTPEDAAGDSESSGDESSSDSGDDGEGKGKRRKRSADGADPFKLGEMKMKPIDVDSLQVCVCL